MSRIGVHLLCIVVACLALLLSLSAARAEDETATFTFSPLVRTMTVEKTASKTSINGEETENSVKEEHYRTTAKHTDTGFTLTETLVSASKTTNGDEDTVEPYTQAFLNIDISIDTDPTGKLLAIHGLDKLSANAKKVFPDDEYPIYQAIFTEKALQDAIADDWQTQTGVMIGKTVKTGDAWTTKGRMPLPDGKYATLTTATTVAGFKTVNGKRCVRLTYETSIDLKALSRAMTNTFKAMPRPEGMKAPVVKVTSYSLKGERLVDPKTMETLVETSTEIRESRITAEGAGTFTMVEEESKDSHEEMDSLWKANSQTT